MIKFSKKERVGTKRPWNKNKEEPEGVYFKCGKSQGEEEVHGVWVYVEEKLSFGGFAFVRRVQCSRLLTEFIVVVLDSIDEVVILSPRVGVFQPFGKVAAKRWDNYHNLKIVPWQSLSDRRKRGSVTVTVQPCQTEVLTTFEFGLTPRNKILTFLRCNVSRRIRFNTPTSRFPSMAKGTRLSSPKDQHFDSDPLRINRKYALSFKTQLSRWMIQILKERIIIKSSPSHSSVHLRSLFLRATYLFIRYEEAELEHRIFARALP